MKDDEQVKKWLAEHAEQIGPEELLFESEKQKLFNGSWPQPCEIENLGVFIDIKDSEAFNDIVGNPENWSIILNNQDLFNKWVLPYAVLHFGKLWFDRVKRQSSISRGVPFPLFSENNYENGVENTPQGRARIAKIVEKVSTVLRTYLEGKWYSGSIRKPSGYIIESLKNEFVKEVGLDMGYKFRSVPACPYCLTLRPQSKVALYIDNDRKCSCPRCEAAVRNLNLEIESLKLENDVEKLQDVIRKRDQRKVFEKFIGITCVCPSNSCNGHFVPISCVDYSKLGKRYVKGALQNFSVGKNTQSFRHPPVTMLDFPLTCPYCGTNFTPRRALKQASGFKGKSGYFTGLPSIRVWVKKEETILDTSYVRDDRNNTRETYKHMIPASHVDSDDQIVIKQRLNILAGEIAIQMNKLNKSTVSGLSTWYFLMAALFWMSKYPRDANNYFFNWKERKRNLTDKEKVKYPGQTKRKVVTNTRGRETAVHQAIFKEWMDVLENNIQEFTSLDRRIRSLKDFKWFARRPSFTGGPETIFYSIVDEYGRISNKTPIRKYRSRSMPRLTRIYSIRLNGKEYIQDMELNDWQSIKLMSNTVLKFGDKVLIEGLVMSSHPTHAPIQRILRLRSMLLKDIIDKILIEERTGNSDKEFWKSWKRRVENAKRKLGVAMKL